MSGPVVLVVAYPSTTPDGKAAKFDMDYYTKSHMSLIAQAWTPYGMQSWSIVSLSSSDSLDGSTPPFCVTANVQFDSFDNMKKALMEGSEETGKDVANYTDVKPEIWVSRLVKEERSCQG